MASRRYPPRSPRRPHPSNRWALSSPTSRPTRPSTSDHEARLKIPHRELLQAWWARVLRCVCVTLPASPQSTHRLFRVVERDELDEIGADPNVLFALAGSLGVSFGSDASGVAAWPANGGAHGFFPTDFPEILTGSVGRGAGFERGRTVHRMGLTEVADLIAMLLDVDFESPDGPSPLGVLTAGD